MPTKTKEINDENVKKEKKAVTKTTKAASKKSTTSKSKKAVSTKKTSTSKAVSTRKKSTAPKSTTASSKKSSVRKTTTKKAVARKKVDIVEYYDLPYRYNETVVKILYQTPNTLFVYWDISDTDRENYIKQYGENFFNITRPVLIIHNNTMNYSFEIPINDFANSWYLRISDSKCDYKVELGRRPNYYNEEASKEIQENIKTDYIYISSSNEIESPNDHVLFKTNENNTITFRNIKNHKETSISLYNIIKNLPAMKKSENVPYISEEILKSMYLEIYENKDISLFEKLTNPSSNSSSSGSMLHRGSSLS